MKSMENVLTMPEDRLVNVDKVNRQIIDRSLRQRLQSPDYIELPIWKS